MTRIKLHILLILGVFLTSMLNAQTVSFTAQSKTTVSVGERFNISYTLNTQGTNFKGPQMKDFTILSGPNTSSSSSVQIINGQITQSASYTYSFVVQALKEGTFNIPPATINVDNKEYKSNSLNINVVAGSANQQQQQQQQRNQTPQNNTQYNTSDQVFLRAVIDKSNPIQGEQIMLTYKLYYRVQIYNYEIDSRASYNDFWTENLSSKGNLKQYNEVVNGINYNVAEILQVVLFPQRSGKLKIEPQEIKCDLGGFFFRNMINVKSNTLTIDVAPFPSQNRTAEFKGSVGNYTLKSEIDKNTLKTNEAATLKIKISGKGNIKMIEEPKINFPPNLENYAPKVTDNITINETGVSGSRTFEYLIIPRSSGEFKINPYVFSFYNPSTKKYETLSTESIVLNVEKGTEQQTGTPVNIVNKEDVKYIGTDIRFIKNSVLPLKIENKHFYNTRLFYLLFLLPLVLFILFIIIWRRHIKIASNSVLVKNRKANKLARKKLKQAALYMSSNKHELFYDEVSKAMWGYLNFKFNIPFSDLSKDTVYNTFKLKEIPDELAEQFINVLNQCEFARFAPGDKNHIMENIYKEAIDIVTKIEKRLK